MSIAIECRQFVALDVSIGNDIVNVKIPPIANDPQYLNILDRLLKLRDELAPMTWVFDLSELQDIPLALASILLGFAEQARKLAWEVRFIGVRNGLCFPNIGPFSPARTFKSCATR